MSVTLLPLAIGVPALAGYGYLQLKQHSTPAAARALAGTRDVARLTPKQVERTARRLRTLDKHAEPAETGVALGRLMPHGPALRAPWRDVAVAVMAPGAGKTTALAVPATFEAPGPVVATSNKRDLYDITRNRRGKSRLFDPQHITGESQAMWFDLLAPVDDVESAERFASHFIGTVDDDAKRDIWGPGASELLAGFALAAHYGRRTILDIYDWLSNPLDAAAVDILHTAGFDQVANGVAGIMREPEKTRAGYYTTARVAAKCLRNPAIAAWVTPNKFLPQFDPHDFVRSRDALHLLSKDGGGSAAPLVAAGTDAVIRAGIEYAEQQNGGRLDVPLLLVLDEAANVCKIADLPKLYSHLGSRNIFALTILQSYAQGSHAWGSVGMKELWGAATVKLIGPGMDDGGFGQDLSRLIGDHDVPTTSYGSGHSGSSRNRAMRRDPIMSAADIRALKLGTALLFATGSKPALVKLQPYYEDKRWRHAA